MPKAKNTEIADHVIVLRHYKRGYDFEIRSAAELDYVCGCTATYDDTLITLRRLLGELGILSEVPSNA